MDKSDEELAADVRMLWQELHKAEREMKKRGYEVRKASYMGSDRTSVEFRRNEIVNL